MNFTLGTGVSQAFQFGTALLERLWPDPAQRAAAQAQLEQLEQTGELAKLQAAMQVQLAQADVDKAEASSTDPFRADWRPFIGWTCGIALFYDFVLRPLLAWGTALWAPHAALPQELDLSTLLPLLGSMLGVGAIQTAHAIKKGK